LKFKFKYYFKLTGFGNSDHVEAPSNCAANEAGTYFSKKENNKHKLIKI